MRIYINEAPLHAGAEVQIAGWLHKKRSSGETQ
jgi:aspartyl/asparaginyl-tRNA synthetase